MTKKEIYSIVREIMARHHDNSNRNDLASEEISKSIHDALNNIPSSASIICWLTTSTKINLKHLKNKKKKRWDYQIVLNVGTHLALAGGIIKNGTARNYQNTLQI